MTKTQLVESVKKGCNGDNISKRLADDVIDAAFENIKKVLKKINAFPTQVLEPFR